MAKAISRITTQTVVFVIAVLLLWFVVFTILESGVTP